MIGNATTHTQKVVNTAVDEARQTDEEQIQPIHLLMALINSNREVVQVMEDLGASDATLRSIRPNQEKKSRQIDNMTWAPGAKHALKLAQEEAAKTQHKFVTPGHLLLGLVKLGDEKIVQLLEKAGIREDELRRAILNKIADKQQENRGQVVSVRVDEVTLRAIDTLVLSRAMKSRSEGAFFLIKKGIEAQTGLLEQLEDKRRQVEALQSEMRELFSGE